MKYKNILVAARILLLSFLLASCQPAWEIIISSQGQDARSISAKDVTFYIEASQEKVDAIPLGQLLYANGFSLIEEVKVVTEGEESSSFTWDDVASTATISNARVITIDEHKYLPTRVEVTPSSLAGDISLSILDIAPTMADVLGLPDLPDSTRGTVSNENAKHGVMILLDGTQYQKLLSLISAGKLPFFETLPEISQGLTVYPPVTTSATAALLTGTPPDVNGVYGYGYRSTEITTLFDLAVNNGKRVVAVEGASLAFNLRNAETSLSGDRDGNGFSDDNVFRNSLDVIHSDMPDLLYIHFHEIDDMGHTYGPDSEEYESAIIRVDEYLAEIFQALPADTLIAIFADHGMHATENSGNHGTLTAADLIIPIIFLKK